MFKKIVSVAVAAGMLLSMALSTAVYADETPVWDGSCSRAAGALGEMAELIHGGEHVIHITSPDQLAALAIYGGRTSAAVGLSVEELKFSGITFILDNDIDLNNKPWSPICSRSPFNMFMGNFDGNGHTIFNMYGASSEDPGNDATNMYNVASRNPAGRRIFGLFGFLGGTVKNLKLKNVTWDYDSDIADNKENFNNQTPSNWGGSIASCGAIAAYLGSYQDITVDGVKNNYKASIDNCSVENVNFRIKYNKDSATCAACGIAGLLYNGSITDTYVKGYTVDLTGSNEKFTRANCCSTTYQKGNKYLSGWNDAKGQFEIKYDFALNTEITLADGTTKTKAPFLYNAAATIFVTSSNWADITENDTYDGYPTKVVDEEDLRTKCLWAGYYSEGEGSPVLLRSEVPVSGAISLDYDTDDSEFTAKANLATAENGTMLVIAVYDEDPDGNLKLAGCNIVNYDRYAQFNSEVTNSYGYEFDWSTQIAKAFVIAPSSLEPYIGAKTYEYVYEE